MEEEEGGSYEAMMDDQNHNNWEAAVDGFRQPPPPPPPPASIPAPVREPPGGHLLAVPAASVDRKGPKEGLSMGPPPEANGVIMMLKSCDTAATVAKAAPAPNPSSTININTSTSKFCESGLPPRPRPPSLFCSQCARRVHPVHPKSTLSTPGGSSPVLFVSGLLHFPLPASSGACCPGQRSHSPQVPLRRDPDHRWLSPTLGSASFTAPPLHPLELCPGR